jgi:hypothetical protein
VSAFRVVLVTEYDVHYFLDGSRFIWSAVNIVDWNGTTKSSGCELVPMHIIPINEKSGGSTVNESIDGLCLLSVRGDDLHLNVERIGRGGGGNYVPSWKSPLPSLQAGRVDWM